MKIVSLLDNISKTKKLKSEHGLSFYLNKNNKHFIIDTGHSGKFLQNAKTLDIDINNLDGIIISHNHSDHIGGLAKLLDRNKKVKVYIKNAARSKFYRRTFSANMYVGNQRQLFQKYADRFIFFDEDLKISDSINLLSSKNNKKHFTSRDLSMLEKKDEKFIQDKFKHELFVLLEKDNRLTIVSSCSHNGIINIVNTVKKMYPEKPISHVIGGFHLMGFGKNKLNCSETFVKEIANNLDNSCEDTIYTCHCTGRRAYKIMKKEIGNKINYLYTGGEIII